MAIDAVVLHHLAQELNECLSGARIDKIQQPGKYEVVFLLRTREGNERLLFSLAAQPCVFLTRERRKNPDKAPMFCMLLRKHLTGGKILSVSQPGMERVLIFQLECVDELGERSVKTLIAELIGRHANLILVGADGRIIECIKRVDYEMSSARPVLPGLFYLPPLASSKPLFFETDEQAFSAILSSAPPMTPTDKWLTEAFWGLSPLVSREITYRATGDVSSPLPLPDEKAKSLFEELQLASGAVEHAAPLLFTRPGEVLPFDFSFIPITQYGPVETEKCESWSALLTRYFEKRASAQQLFQARQALTKEVRRARDKLAKKIREQTSEFETACQRESLKRAGDLLMAGLHLTQKGMNSVSLVDLFDEAQPTIEIRLDPRLSPRENAQKYYHDYARMKNAERFLSDQLSIGTQRLSYLESILDELERADSLEILSEIREELIASGQIKADRKRKKPPLPVFRPRKYRTRGGFCVWVGRNNRENEQLTLKTAKRSDLWFHVKNAPGAHVVLSLEGRIPSDKDLEDAAMLAALHSRLSASALVPVDYTEIRHVKKLKGGGPGMVTYNEYKTSYLTPNPKAAAEMEDSVSEAWAD